MQMAWSKERTHFRFWILGFRFQPKIFGLVSCVFLVFCFGSPDASAEYEVEHTASLSEGEDEASTEKVAVWSTLPYLKRLGRDHIQAGALHLHLTPQDAHVYLDGKTLEDLKQEDVTVVQHEAEKQPFLAFENLIPGTHALRVTKGSHSTSFKNVLIESGSERAVEVKLHSRWRFLILEALTLASIAAVTVVVSIIAKA